MLPAPSSNRTLRFCTLLLFASACFGLMAQPALANGTAGHLFADDWELSDNSSWGRIVGGPTPLFPDAYRFTDVDLRDPHFFPNFMVIGCTDITDVGVPFLEVPSVNETAALAIITDADQDGCLDLSSMLLFRPLDALGTNEVVDGRGGRCTVPVETTTCSADTSAGAARALYSGQLSGTCLEALVNTTSGYSPSITEPAGPCFVTAPVDTSITILEGLNVPMKDVQYAATFVGGPTPGLVSGMIRGFLTEADANTTLIPAQIPLLGGDPLSSLLPGGTNNCDGGDDRDMHEGQSGWWFYINFEAEPATWTGL